jgi:superfamily II DNA/RNA helicase
MPATRQTLLFSATLDSNIVRLASVMMRNPMRVEVDSQQAKHVNIAQHMHFADDMGHKNRLLDHLLRGAEVNQAIVFTATKRSADELALDLHSKGFAVAALHGDMNQGARNRTLQALHRGRVRVLVATDVAARGIDIHGISHVINYDLPRQAEDYVHRIGRTGRAGRNGTAISLVNAREHAQVRTIERFTAQPIPVSVIAGLEPKVRSFAKPSAPSRRPAGKSWGNKPTGGRSFRQGR